jgi:hypothetical protein
MNSSSGLPPVISATFLNSVFWAVCLALGYRILRLLKVPLAPFSRWERGVVCCAVGAGFLQYGPYALGAFGELFPNNVLLGFALIFVLLLPDLVRIGRAVLRAINHSHQFTLGRAQQIWLLLLAFFLGIMLLQALTLTAFGADDDGYHLSAPRRFLADGFLSYLPTYTTTNASLGFEMFYVIGLASGSLGLKIIHFSAGIFCLLTLWLCSRRLGSGHAGVIAISLLLISTPICNFPALLGVAFVDFGACWMTLTSVLVWLAWRERTDQSTGRLLILMALVTGFAASFKSTALTVAVAWVPILIWEARRLDMGWARILSAAVVLGIIAGIPVSPWLFRSWNLTGNPIFPMLSNLIPTRDWNPDIAVVFGKFLHYYSWGIASHMSEGTRKAVVSITAVLVLASSLVTILRLRDVVLRVLIGFSASMVLMTLATAGMVFRYWLAAQMCVALVLSVVLVRRFRTAPATRWLPCLLLLVALIVEIHNPATPITTDFRVATGMTTLDQEYAFDPAWDMWRYINEHTTNDAHMLVGAFYTTFGAANYGCHWLNLRCFTSDSYIQSFIRLNDWQSFVRSLNQAGIHYLLISDKQFNVGRLGFSFVAEQNEYPFCRRLADQYGKKLAQFGNLQFYSFGTLPEVP